jgi:hypothetical protein
MLTESCLIGLTGQSGPYVFSLSPYPVLPDHEHCGGIELAVTEQLAADIFTHFWFAGA